MNYPTGNLKNDYEDINSKNYKIIAEYDNLIKDAAETGNFSKVDAFIKIPENAQVLAKNVRTADSMNELVNFVESLINYTIAMKNQIHFIEDNEDNIEDFDIANYFNSLNEEIVPGDIIIFTRNNGTTNLISKVKKVLDNEIYFTLIEMNPASRNIYCYDIGNNDIKSVSDSGENFDFYVYGHGGGQIVVRVLVHYGYSNSSDSTTYSDAYFIDLNSIDISTLQEGDTIRLKCSNTLEHKNVAFFKIGDKFFLTDTFSVWYYDSSNVHIHNDGNSQGISLYNNSVFDFVYLKNALSISEDLGPAGYITYDSKGNCI